MMIARNSTAFVLSSALALATIPGGAQADGGSAFVGGLIGSALGSAIVNNQQRQQQQRTVVRRAPAPTVNTYQRQQNREVQTALNHFNFPAGVADGVMGRNSRTAVSMYQNYMSLNGAPYYVSYGTPGVLAEHDRVLLVSCYQRAVSGGYAVVQATAAEGKGHQGYLIHCLKERNGIVDALGNPIGVPQQHAAVQAPQAQALPVTPAAPAPEIEVREVPKAAETIEASVAAPEAAPAGLPSFLSGPSTNSMSSFCNRVSMSTGSNGGYMTAASMSDPKQALGEQFCLARSYAVEQGDSLAGAVQGFSMAEIREQCEAFAPSMFEYQARLVTQSPAEAGAALQNFVVSTGAPPAQLSANSRICLGIGYNTDNPELALAAAMVLVGLGEEAYSELLGHHLMNGFATPKRSDRAMEWYEISIAALDSGASPLVVSAGNARTELLRIAVAGGTGAAPQPVIKDASVPSGEAGSFLMPMPTQGSSN